MPQALPQSTTDATDTRVVSFTPEGAALHYDVAGIGPRAYALVIDVLIRTLIMIVASIGVALIASNFAFGLLLIFYFLIEWFYPVYFEVLRDGQTPGKKRLGLRVIHDDGSPVGFSASVLRNLLRIADFLPLFYATGGLTMMASSRLQRLGDMAAGTYVIYVDDARTSSVLSHQQVLMPRSMLSQAKQRAVVSLAVRESELSPERMEELSCIIMQSMGEELANYQPDWTSATAVVVGFANYYLGHISASNEPGLSNHRAVSAA